jgi:hypothetical protein
MAKMVIGKDIFTVYTKTARQFALVGVRLTSRKNYFLVDVKVCAQKKRGTTFRLFPAGIKRRQ